jgi:glycosyltransferase A (GT-A) superfamily protein (DUF2064 family)
MVLLLLKEHEDCLLFSGGGSSEKIQELTGKPSHEQVGDHLGQRMANAFVSMNSVQQNEKQGQRLPVLLSGTDIPEYRKEHALEAAEILQTSDCVLIDSGDGGYSMIGFNSDSIKRSNFHQLFEDIEWSTPEVLDRQIENLKKFNYSFTIMEPLEDIDTVHDLNRYLKRNPESAVAKALPGVAVILPVYNEEESLPEVLNSIPLEFFKHVVVADNGSTDRSREIAIEAGCELTICEQRGYGATCLTAMEYLERFDDWQTLLFLDADGSDDPNSIFDVLSVLLNDQADLCCGNRIPEDNRALQFHQRAGNWLATFLIRIFWKHRYNDLGPLRAIHRSSLKKLQMDDLNFGWTIQMQIRAIKQELKVKEVDVAYRKRFAGKSKVSGSIKGSFLAGSIILRTVWKELFLAK